MDVAQTPTRLLYRPWCLRLVESGTHVEAGVGTSLGTSCTPCLMEWNVMTDDAYCMVKFMAMVPWPVYCVLHHDDHEYMAIVTFIMNR